MVIKQQQNKRPGRIIEQIQTEKIQSGSQIPKELDKHPCAPCAHCEATLCCNLGANPLTINSITRTHSRERADSSQATDTCMLNPSHLPNEVAAEEASV